MQQAVYNRFRNVVYEATGINLGPSKQALVASRVGKRMRALGVADYRDYIRIVSADESGVEMTHLVDAICTNVTSFFREDEHFAFVRSVVAERAAAGQDRFRIWSAACSTGEEPYSLAMSLQDLSSETCDIRILGTDLSTKALRVALAGRYPENKLVSVHPEVRDRYFDVVGSDEGREFVVTREIRDMVTFRQLNLANPPFPMNGSLDIVLCRNVMIYFDKPVRDRLLAEIHRLLTPGGYLSIGHAESFSGKAFGFEALRPSVYVRR